MASLVPTMEERKGDPFYCQNCWHDVELHTHKREYRGISRCNGWKPNKTFEERCDCTKFIPGKNPQPKQDGE